MVNVVRRFVAIDQMEAKARDDEFSIAERRISGSILKVERALDARLNSYYQYSFMGQFITRKEAVETLERAVKLEARVRVRA